MGTLKTVTIKNRVIVLYSFQGEVMEAKKWTHTEVSGGGGGGGYSHQGTGYFSGSAPITSTTTTHDQFFLRSADGEERAFEFSDMYLAMRSGHRVSVIWGIQEGEKSGEYVAIYNHTTKEVTYAKKGMEKLAANKFVAVVGFLLGIVGIPIMLGSFWIGLAFVGAGGWIYNTQLVRLKCLRSALESRISEIKAMPLENLGTSSAIVQGAQNPVSPSPEE